MKCKRIHSKIMEYNMNTFPCLQFDDVFFQVSNNTLSVIYLNEVIMSYPVDFPMKAFHSDITVMNGQTSIFYPQLYSPLLAAGSSFIQFYDQIYEVQFPEVRLISRIPDLPMSHPSCFYLKMFYNQNQLCFTNQSEIYCLQE